MSIGAIFTSALENAIKDQARIFDYGDKATFSELWTMDKKSDCPKAFRKKCGEDTKNESASKQYHHHRLGRPFPGRIG